jgi:signal peptidase I
VARGPGERYVESTEVAEDQAAEEFDSAGDQAEGANAAEDQGAEEFDGVTASGHWRSAKTRPRRRLTLRPGTWVFVLVVAALAVWIPAAVARLYEVPSGSMETTLHGCPGCDNDRVLVDRLVYRFHRPTVGDIVVFAVPSSWQNTEAPVARSPGPLARAISRFEDIVGIQRAGEVDFIKRVIALGGQTVSCCDARNRLIRDGESINEPYIYFAPEFGPPGQKPFGPVKVPPGMIWVMGDSRNNSEDSRINGPVPINNVIGEARLVVAPFSRFGIIGGN